MHHLQSLIQKLEEKTTGNPLDDVASIYRTPLTEDLVRSINDLTCDVSTHVYLNGIVNVLRDFMIDQLTSDRWDVNESLCEYLTYTTNLDEEVERWMVERFPAGLCLAHAYAVYVALVDALQ